MCRRVRAVNLNTVHLYSSLVVYLKKVSLYVDEKLWSKFKEAVLRKHGTLRKLSSEVENLIRLSLINEEIQRAFEKMNVDVRVMISPEEIKRSRSKLRGPPSEDLIRDMRGKRIAEGIS
ncbi:hypothetical protein HRbin06_01015 [archaeon HR06]|nr:hypothetical protein HRbin06_01015 [archaeon HR06]